MLSISRKAAVGLTLLAALVAAVAVALIASQSEATPSAVSESAKQKFSVLKPSTPSTLERLPAELRPALSLIESANPGAGPPTEVGVTGAPEKGRALVAATGSMLCVATAKDGMSCGEEEQVVAGKIFGARPEGCNAYSVTGLVPDGIEHLTVDVGGDGTADGSLAVEGNVYAATLKATDTTLSSDDGSVKVSLPLDWYASQNESC
jgi:hypothetical protein